MTYLHNLIADNQEAILFVYGLIFFILGFAIILQVRRSSRLELARSLFWLVLRTETIHSPILALVKCVYFCNRG